MVTGSSPRTVGLVLFDGFELLDAFGPQQVLGVLPHLFEVVLLGPSAGAVTSSTGGTPGPQVVASHSWEDSSVAVDLLLVPGGQGTRVEVGNERLLAAVRHRAASAELVTSVCTGAAVLAAAGLLDGRRATSNKRAFEWVRTQGTDVEWVPEARWVVDGKMVTSGGVAAGIDMAFHLIERLHGHDLASRVATGIEYEWHDDPSWDPFAAAAGLV